MKTNTEQQKENLEGYIKTNQGKIASAREILGALEKWDKKLIDKRFFVSNFSINGEYRNWTKYQINQSRYSWKSELELTIGNNEYIEINTRETSEIKKELESWIEKWERWGEGYRKEIEELEELDEAKIIEQIVDVYRKNKVPQNLWAKILDTYEVKYPKDEL